MKKITYLLLLSILLVSISHANNVNNYNLTVSTQSVSPTPDEFQGLSRPILVSISNAVPIRERNETLGNGAVYNATVNTNVTITYKVVNGLNTTAVLLYADLPGVYSLTNSSETARFEYVETKYENLTLPYDKSIEIINGSIAYYKVEINVTAGLIPFYASTAGLNEDALSSPRNLITTQQYWDTSSTESFFTQAENVTISLVANNTFNVDKFGISYQISDDSDFTSKNFTLTRDGNNDTSIINLGKYDVGTKITWMSIAYLNDSVINMTRVIDRIEYKTVEVADGTPTIDVKIESFHKDSLLKDNVLYSQNGTVYLNFSAVVSKGNITHFIIENDGVNTTIQTSENASIAGEAMNHTIVYDEGKHNLTIFAYSSKNLVANETFLVIIDHTAPTLSLNIEGTSSKITANDGAATFDFDFNDDNAGIRYAIIDFGDGFSIDVQNYASYTHRYVNVNGTQTFTVTLTVIDWAGNTNSKQLTVTVEYKENLTVTSAPTMIPFLIFVAILVIIPFLPKIFNPILEKFQK